MILFKRSQDLRHWISEQKNKGKITGFVPTMGALHEGHMELIKACRSMVDLTICSIFVNPAQFNDPKDFEKYPVSTEKDIQMLHQAGTDVLFLPSVDDIYPQGQGGLETYDLGSLETLLEGRYRPGHFQGVSQVMSRLLKLVKPDHLFMGQKDYQQCMVIKKLIESYNLKVYLHVVPTQREDSGLAMSSRNLLLSDAAKQKATTIYNALNFIKDNLSNIPLPRLKDEAKSILLTAGFEKIDYIEICDANTLMPLTEYNNKTKMVALAAAFIEGVRLIDNLILN